MCDCLPCAPYWGPAQPRRVPCELNQPPFGSQSRCSIHWATPARLNKPFVNDSCSHWLECGRIHIHKALIQSADIICCNWDSHLEKSLWHPTYPWPQWRNTSIRSSQWFPFLMGYNWWEGRAMSDIFFCIMPPSQTPGIIPSNHIQIGRHRGKKVLVFTKMLLLVHHLEMLRYIPNTKWIRREERQEYLLHLSASARKNWHSLWWQKYRS